MQIELQRQRQQRTQMQMQEELKPPALKPPALRLEDLPRATSDGHLGGERPLHSARIASRRLERSSEPRVDSV